MRATLVGQTKLLIACLKKLNVSDAFLTEGRDRIFQSLGPLGWAAIKGSA